MSGSAQSWSSGKEFRAGFGRDQSGLDQILLAEVGVIGIARPMGRDDRQAEDEGLGDGPAETGGAMKRNQAVAGSDQRQQVVVRQFPVDQDDLRIFRRRFVQFVAVLAGRRDHQPRFPARRGKGGAEGANCGQRIGAGQGREVADDGQKQEIPLGQAEFGAVRRDRRRGDGGRHFDDGDRRDHFEGAARENARRPDLVDQKGAEGQVARKIRQFPGPRPDIAPAKEISCAARAELAQGFERRREENIDVMDWFAATFLQRRDRGDPRGLQRRSAAAEILAGVLRILQADHIDAAPAEFAREGGQARRPRRGPGEFCDEIRLGRLDGLVEPGGKVLPSAEQFLRLVELPFDQGAGELFLFGLVPRSVPFSEAEHRRDREGN